MAKIHLINATSWRSSSPTQLLIENGRVVEGSTEGAEVVDLRGRILAPKFVDNHCHILPTGLDLNKPQLAGLTSKSTVLDALSRAARERPNGWLHAVRYDPTALPEGEALTGADLDKIATDRPILVRYVSGHASVGNAAAFAAARVHRGTPDPEGGIYERDASGRLTGVATEDAHETLTAAMPTPTVEEMTDAILAAGRSMAGYGIGTASDMMTGRFDLLNELVAYRRAAELGNPIRVRLWVQWRDVFGRRGIGADRLLELAGEMDETMVALRGIKIFADGAIGSGTAAIYGQYQGDGSGGQKISTGGLTLGGDKSGQLIYAPERLTAMTVEASRAGFGVAVHAIGDYAAELVMDAFEATGDPSRHRLEHAMLLSDAQIERLARLNPYVTFQPEFLAHFGHLYRRQLGEARARTLIRARSVRDAGLRISLSSDRPIVEGDPRVGMRAITERPDGGERLTEAEALLGTTSWGAEANGDAGLVGSLAPGEMADWQPL